MKKDREKLVNKVLDEVKKTGIDTEKMPEQELEEWINRLVREWNKK